MTQATFPATPSPTQSFRTVVPRSYWSSVWATFVQDRITVFALFLLLLLIVVTLLAPWISTTVLGYDPNKTNLRERNKPPTWAVESWQSFQDFTHSCQSEQGCAGSLWTKILYDSWQGLQQCASLPKGKCHWLGTDDAGRDVLTRGIYGGRISLRIGVFVAAITLTIGLLMGLISGYYATTWIDDIANAIFMLIDSVPILFLLIILSRIFQPSPEALSFLIGIFSWVGLSRGIRGKIFAMRERDFVIAGRAVGSTGWQIMIRHILPNISSLVIVYAVFEIASAILAEATLSFLGVGIGPPHASWGNMMEGSLGNFTSAPWLVITPGFFIFLTTLSIFLIGDGLRDAFDPTLKNKA